MRESSHSTKEGDARRLLKLREGDIEHDLPVDPKLNRIRFEEAAEGLKTEYAVNGRRSADELERRIRLHLMPHFGGRRLAAIATTDINRFILTRQADVIAAGERPRPARGAEAPSASERGWGPASSEKSDDRKERRFSNDEINRELTTLKRILNLAPQNGKLTHVPHIPMLKEWNVRTGFFEREQLERVLDLLPPQSGQPCSSRTSLGGGFQARFFHSSGDTWTSRRAWFVWTRTQPRTTKAAPSRSPTRYNNSWRLRRPSTTD